MNAHTIFNNQEVVVPSSHVHFYMCFLIDI